MVGTPEADDFNARGNLNPATQLEDEEANFAKLCKAKCNNNVTAKVGKG